MKIKELDEILSGKSNASTDFWKKHGLYTEVTPDYIDSFISGAANYINSAADEYSTIDYNSSSSVYNSREKAYKLYKSQSKIARDYINSNRKNYSEENYNSYIKQLDNIDSLLDQTYGLFSDANSFYSSFANETLYNDYIKSIEADDKYNKQLTEYDVTKGAEGWDKYLSDVAASKAEKAKAEEEKKWYVKLGEYWGETQDTTLPLATLNQAVSNYRKYGDESGLPNDEWSEEEKYAFGALYSDDKNSAFSFAKQTNARKNKTKEEEKLKAIQEQTNENWWTQTRNTLGAVFASMTGIVDTLDNLAKRAAGLEVSTDGNISPFEWSQAVKGAVSTDLNEKFGTIDTAIGNIGWGDLYQLGVSRVESLLNGVLFGNAGTLVSYFGQASASGVSDALSRGASQDEAILYGAACGVFEGLFEMIGVGRLLSLKSGDGAKGFIKNLVKQAVEEGAEEGLTTTFSTIFDVWITADHSNREYVISQYMSQGLSREEAEKQAVKDELQQIAYDTIGGAVSGALGGAMITGAKNTFNNITTGREFNGNTIATQKVLTDAAEIGSKADKYINKFGEKGRLSGRDINTLLRYIRSGDKSKIAKGAAETLDILGETKDKKAISEAIAKVIAGDELARSEKRTLRKSDYARSVLEALDPNTINAQTGIQSWEDSNNPDELAANMVDTEWAENLNTKLINPEEYGRASTMKAVSERIQKALKLVYNGGDDDSESLDELAKQYGEQAEAMKRTFIEGQELSRYDSAFKIAFNMGKDGVSESYAMNSDSTSYLTEEQKKIAYELGKESAKSIKKDSEDDTIKKTEAENGSIRIREGGERSGSENTKEQVSRMESGSRKAQVKRASEGVADKEAARLVDEGREISVANLGIFGGSADSTVRVIDKENETASMQRARKLAEARGLSVTFFVGDNLAIKDKDGKMISARAYISTSGKHVFVRGDHSLYTAEQLMNHELGHDKIAKGEISVSDVRERLKKLVGESNYEALAEIYEEAYSGSGLTAEEIWEEIICDSLGDMNVFAENAIGTFTGLILSDIKTTAENEAKSPTQTRGSPEEAKTSGKISDANFSIEFADAIAENQRKYAVSNTSMISADALEKAIADTAHMVNEMKPYANILPQDKIGKTLVKNGSYDVSVENTTICIRTLAYNSFVDMVSEKVGRPLTQMESFLVSQKLYEIAKEPQCLYCYVSLDRKAFNEMVIRYVQQRDAAIEAYKKAGKPKIPTTMNAEWSLFKDFLDGRKATANMWERFTGWLKAYNNGDTMVSLSDISTEAKRLEIVEKGGSLASQVKDILKYAQSASWAKKQTQYVAYYDEILKLKPSVIRNLNQHYGMRWYSFSDYSGAFIVENMQQITDAAIRGLKGLSYTKDTDFAEIFAPTGMNINISVYAKKGENGYEIDAKQSANIKEAIKLRDQYPNVGIVVVATDKAGVEWALEQEWSDVVIPFHTVRTGAEVAEFYNWEIFNSEQSDVVSDQNLWDAYVNEGGKKKASKMVYPSEHQNDREIYLSLCKKRGLTPRFKSFLDNPNYMKLVNETRQSESQTLPLKAEFDITAAERSFDKFVEKGGYYEGWYNDGIDVDGEAEIVAQDVRAGKKANEVDYGRQDVDFDALARGRKTNREHGKASRELSQSEWKTSNKKPKYISYAKIGQSNIDYINRELRKLYFGLTEGIADGIAIANKNTVFIIDSGKENGRIDFGVRKILTISDNLLRDDYVRRTNDDTISKGLVSDELLAKLGDGYDNNRRSNLRSESGSKLQADKGKSENQQSGVSQNNADKRGLNGKTSRELDTAYLDAVNRGDMETAQRMVDEAAKNAGYTVKGLHATNSEFTEFDISKTSENNFHGKGIYFTNSVKDLENNYENHEGPDPWQKIEDRAYELVYDKYGISYEDTLTSDTEIIDKLNECYDIAIDEFKKSGRRITAYLRFDNPLILEKGMQIPYDYSGYDGIIDKQVYENIGHSGMDENTIHYVVFNPNNIKSADPVTYDDDGNVIPLSERFNTQEKDIRYSRELDIVDYINENTERAEAISNRTLLANALESITTDEAEKTALRKYKDTIYKIEAEEAKLEANRAEAQTLRFKKGRTPEETRKLKVLDIEANTYKTQINNYDKKLLRLEATTTLKKVIEREVENSRKKAMAKSKEMLGKYRMRGEMGELRNKIKEFKSKIESTLQNPSEANYIPVGLFETMVDVCNLINIDTNLYKADGALNKAQAKRDATKLKLADLSIEYAKLKNSSDAAYKGEFDEFIASDILSLMETMKDGNRSLSDLDIDELRDVYDTLRSLAETIRDARKLIGFSEKVDIYEAGDSVIDEQKKITESRRKGKRSAFNKFDDGVANLSLSPVRAVERMSAYNEDSMLYKLMEEVEKGVRKKDKFAMDAYKSFESLTTGKNLKAFESAIYDEVGKEYKDTNGNTFRVSLMEMMQAVLSFERETANKGQEHISKSGFEFADLKLLKKGKISEAVSSENAHRAMFTFEMFNDFTDVLSKSQWAQEYMNAARKFFNETAKDAINEVTLKTKHRIVARDTNYIPYEVDKNFVAQEISAEQNIQQTINSYGMLKDVKDNAPQPLIITGLNNIIERHIELVSNVYGLAIPVRNFNKVWNVNGLGTDSVKSSIEHNWGIGGKKLIEQAIKDVQGPRVSQHELFDKIYQRIKGGYVGATFLLNGSVVFKQIGSLFSAGSMLSYRNGITQMLPNLLYTMTHYKEIAAEVDKYTASAWKRRQGISDEELHTLMSEGKKLKLFRRLPVGLKPSTYIAFMDSSVALSLWKYAKEDVAKRTGLAGEELNKATAEYYDKVIESTQSMSDVLHRPEIQKQHGNILADALSMFKTDLYQMAGQLRVVAGRYSKNKTAENRRALIKTVWSIFGSAVWGTIVTSIFALIRYKVNRYRDDEDELTIESWLERDGFTLLSDLFGYINPLFGSELMGIFENFAYGESGNVVDSIVMDAINNTWKAVIVISNAIRDGEAISNEQWINLAVNTLQVLGVPANNIKRFADAIRLHSEDISNGEWLSFEAGLNKANQKRLFSAYNTKDKDRIEKATRFYETSSELQSAIREALRKYEPRIVTAAEARADGKLEKYEKIVKNLINEKRFEKDDIIAAILAEEAKIRKSRGEITESKETEDKEVGYFIMSDYYTAITKGDYSTIYSVKLDLIDTMVANGYDFDTAERTFNNKFANHLKGVYEDGKVSAANAMEYLVSYGGKTRDEADSKVRWWIFQDTYPDYSDWRESTVSKYYGEIKASGISVDMYDIFLELKGNLTRRVDVLEAIDSMPLSRSQKDALYLSEGFARSTLGEAPWH